MQRRQNRSAGEVIMVSVMVRFSIAEEDCRPLDRLTEKFANGNRSAFLRIAMDHLEALERAEKLQEVQAFGVQHLTAKDLDDVDVEAVVYRVLSRRLKAERRVAVYADHVRLGPSSVSTSR